MKYEVHIGMDNAAFEDAPGDELARILRYLADQLDARPGLLSEPVRLYDVNGNRVGFAHAVEGVLV